MTGKSGFNEYLSVPDTYCENLTKKCERLVYVLTGLLDALYKYLPSSEWAVEYKTGEFTIIAGNNHQTSQA